LLTFNSALKDQDIADAALYMLSQPLNVSIKAMDVVPTGIVDRDKMRTWLTILS